MSAPSPRPTSFEQFWPFYLGEHSLPATRAMHFIGTSLSLVFGVGLTLFTGRPVFILAGLLNGYAWAWVSHFFIEKNKPASFKFPLWSFAADWKMWAMILTGKINGELTRLGIQPRAAGLAVKTNPSA